MLEAGALQNASAQLHIRKLVKDSSPHLSKAQQSTFLLSMRMIVLGSVVTYLGALEYPP